MSINEFSSIVAPPQEPSETSSKNRWAEVTDRFGFPLPFDYTKFIDLYGSGQIGNWLTVFNPFSSNKNISLIDQFFSSLSGLSELKKEFPDSIPYPLLFEPGGLLPWGLSIDGDLFCWATTGTNGKWSIVLICRHSDPEEYRVSFTEFLIEAIKGNIKSAAIPQEWPTSKVDFVSYKL